jgi:ubiquinone/menaquinone biosynthesis C-methylase UbiE
VDPSIWLACEYSDKADAYAQQWSPVIAPMAKPLLDRLSLARARSILDLGAGTGAFLADLGAAAPFARILAVDRAEGMLRIAQRQTKHPLAVMDAESLGIRSEAVDVATLVFMLFHVPDPATALREVFRVLRAGGTVGIVTWGRDDGVPGLSIWKEELDAAGAAPDYRDPVVMQQARMDTPDKISALLASAGYTAIRTWVQMFEHRWTIDDVVKVQLGCGLAARRIGSLSSGVAAECEARVRQRMAELASEALVHRPEILFATASHPMLS